MIYSREDELDDFIGEDYEAIICLNCNGSGKGMHDGTKCNMCKGSGVEYVVREEEDEV